MPTTSIPIPKYTNVSPKLRGDLLFLSTPASCSFWKTWKIVKPKPINDSEVRITDISVRSALIRVRWNDIPVRRDDSSTEMRSEPDSEVIRAFERSCMLSAITHARFVARTLPSKKPSRAPCPDPCEPRFARFAGERMTAALCCHLSVALQASGVIAFGFCNALGER